MQRTFGVSPVFIRTKCWESDEHTQLDLRPVSGLVTGSCCHISSWMPWPQQDMAKVRDRSLLQNGREQFKERKSKAHKALNAQWDTNSMAWKERSGCREYSKRKHIDWAANLHLRETLLQPTACDAGSKKPVRKLWAAGETLEKKKTKTHSTWPNISLLAPS